MLALYVFIGGGLGSLVRYSISLFGKKLGWTEFPVATLISNVVASLLLGVFVALMKERIQHSEAVHALLVIGFCGGFSTFSSFAAENLELFQKGQYLVAICNILISVALCVFAVYIGSRRIG